MSGGTADRPRYQALLTAARNHQFDVIVFEEISRLWRNRAEFGPRSAELEDLGIHCLTCVGDDTRREWHLQSISRVAHLETIQRGWRVPPSPGLVGQRRMETTVSRNDAALSG